MVGSSVSHKKQNTNMCSYRDSSNQQLVKCCLENDRNAWEEFFFRFIPVIKKSIQCKLIGSGLGHLLHDKEVSETSDSTVNDEKEKEEKQPCTGLTLIYQKTDEKIHIDQAKVILGREAFGADILSEIPQISRNHCVIELIGNQYRVSDLDSFNGTYIGTSKINCKDNPKQILNNNELLFLGKELFLVQIHFETQPSMETSDTSIRQKNKTVNGTDQPDEPEQSDEPDESKSVVYRCKNCGKDYNHKKDICDEVCQACGTFNEWEEIEK